MIAKVRIPDNPLHAEIEIDGHRIEHAVRALTIDASANSLPVIRLELAVLSDISVEGVVHVFLNEEIEKALVVLGWTPPPEV